MVTDFARRIVWSCSMIDLDSPKWKDLRGGYRTAYDASPILRALSTSDVLPASFWEDVWNNLYHQGDVGDASYAVMPCLAKIYAEKRWIDYQLPTYAYAVEEARSRSVNEPPPGWLRSEYEKSVIDIANYCLVNRIDCNDPDYGKAVVLLVAIIVGAKDIADLIDAVDIGDEHRALEIYEAAGR
jgi:hypothetical protein